MDTVKRSLQSKMSGEPWCLWIYVYGQIVIDCHIQSYFKYSQVLPKFYHNRVNNAVYEQNIFKNASIAGPFTSSVFTFGTVHI
jgi:hypothetical protein